MTSGGKVGAGRRRRDRLDVPIRGHRPLRAVLGVHELADGPDGGAAPVAVVLQGHADGAHRVPDPAQIAVGEEAGPHQAQDAARAVVGADARAAHLQGLGPDAVEGAQFELRREVQAAGRDGTGRREDPVAADDLAGGLVPDHEMVAELIEVIGVAAVGDLGHGRLEAGFGTEHLVAQPLHRVDVLGAGREDDCVVGTVDQRLRSRRAAGDQGSRCTHGLTVGPSGDLSVNPARAGR
ncbi:hypothetical protein MTP03_34080 [Tsukamurella sp. PLM1]|nr:hypothetical protein MTP03_34080 [Tsukamurella sp. PLM1]